jgi:hypothetical protein
MPWRCRPDRQAGRAADHAFVDDPVSRSSQCRHFPWCEVPDFAGTEAIVHDWPDSHATQADHGMADLVTHLPHLPVPSFAHDQRQQ